MTYDEAILCEHPNAFDDPNRLVWLHGIADTWMLDRTLFRDGIVGRQVHEQNELCEKAREFAGLLRKAMRADIVRKLPDTNWAVKCEVWTDSAERGLAPIEPHHVLAWLDKVARNEMSLPEGNPPLPNRKRALRRLAQTLRLTDPGCSNRSVYRACARFEAWCSGDLANPEVGGRLAPFGIRRGDACDKYRQIVDV